MRPTLLAWRHCSLGQKSSTSESVRRRLLLLGDSMGWGFGVERCEMVSTLLSEHCPEWEVINASVSGYSTDQEYLWYGSEGIKYKPDLVLLLIHNNDTKGNRRSYYYDHQKPRFVVRDGRLALDNVPVPRRTSYEKLRQWLSARSYLAYGYRRARNSKPRSRDPAGRVTEAPKVTGWEVTRRILLRFADELQGEGVAFVWVLIEMDDHKASLFQDSASRINVPVLNLQDIFRDACEQGQVVQLSEYDSHWNALGHQIAATAIRKLLEDSFVDRGSSPSLLP